MAEEMVISLEARTRSLASRIGSLESSFFVSQRAAETAAVILEELTFKQEQMEAEIKQLETEIRAIRELASNSIQSQPSAKKMPMQRVMDKAQGPPKESEGSGERTKCHQDCRRQGQATESV